MDKSLKELLADGAIQASLTGTEQNILRMAANGKSAEAIARLYGCNEQEVERIVADVRTRVASATGGTIKPGAAPKPSTGDSSQAPRPSEGSSRNGGPPAKDRIVAYLSEHGETRQGPLCTATGIKQGSIGDVLRALEKAGVVQVRLDGRAKFLSLAKSAANVPAARVASPAPPSSTLDLAKFVDVAALDAAIDDVHEAIAELEQLRDQENKLLDLRSALKSVGV